MATSQFECQEEAAGAASDAAGDRWAASIISPLGESDDGIREA